MYNILTLDTIFEIIQIDQLITKRDKNMEISNNKI